MSCLLIALPTIKLRPFSLSMAEVVFCVLRDFLLLGYYVFLIVWANFQSESDYYCIDSSGVFSWLFLISFVTVLRILKNPAQYAANKRLQRNGANWNNPDNLDRNWARYFSPSYYLCQLHIYSLVDFASLMVYITGWILLKETEKCKNVLIFQLVHYETMSSMLAYVGTLFMLGILFTIHRISNGRCLPGMELVQYEDSCPFINFDTSLWRQPGETLPVYRARVTNAYHNDAQIGTEQMNHQQHFQQAKNTLSLKELETLPKSRFENDTQTNNENSSKSQCALCFDEYVVDEELRELTCGHSFHAECIDQWLLHQRRTCPICNGDAVNK